MNTLLRRRAMIAAGGGSPTPPGPVIEPVFYDRLVFDGTAYINTDIIPPSNCSFVVQAGNETSKAQQRFFMCDGTNDAAFGALLNNSTTTTNRCFNIFYGGASTASSNKKLAFSTATFTFFLTPNRFGWDSTAYTITKGSNSASAGLIIGSNVSHSGTPYTGRIGTFKIYGSDAQDVVDASGFSSFTPVYTLHPCTYNDVPGLWCVETSRFYGNSASSGSLNVLND